MAEGVPSSDVAQAEPGTHPPDSVPGSALSAVPDEAYEEAAFTSTAQYVALIQNFYRDSDNADTILLRGILHELRRLNMRINQFEAIAVGTLEASEALVKKGIEFLDGNGAKLLPMLAPLFGRFMGGG